MPKFLDAPSWYDDDGNLKTIQGDLTIYVGSGYNITFDVPHVGGTNIDRFGGLGTVSSEYYLLPAASAPGRIPYYVNTNIGYQTLPSGTSGQVLTSNGNAQTPSWKNPSLYTHLIMIGTSATSGASPMKGSAVFSVNNFSSEEYTREEIISFLETVKTQVDDGGSAGTVLDGLPCFFTPDTSYSGETLAPAGYVWAKNGVVYISGITVMTNPVGSGPVFAERTGSLIANVSYLQVFKDLVISAP